MLILLFVTTIEFHNYYPAAPECDTLDIKSPSDVFELISHFRNEPTITFWRSSIFQLDLLSDNPGKSTSAIIIFTISWYFSEFPFFLYVIVNSKLSLEITLLSLP